MNSPLQNRVRPDGEIASTPARGLLMGNRGGKIHDPVSRTLHPTRRWATRQWICCVTSFKNRQRKVMGGSYTELFFLDEVTALAAGHRPCFECRRADAISFAFAWVADKGGSVQPPSAPQMDRILHDERLDGRNKRMFWTDWEILPVGAVVRLGGAMVAKHSRGALDWSVGGYSDGPAVEPRQKVDCLTPPAVLRVLKNGYHPLWHPSAEG